MYQKILVPIDGSETAKLGLDEALRLAKVAYLKVALSGAPGDRPYALRTVLQAQCYGHPGAKL